MQRAISFILFLPLFAAAQGNLINYVEFQNGVLSSPPDRLVRFADGSPMVGTNFMAQLLVGATPDSLQPTTAAPARFRAPGTMFPGMWVGYDIGLPDATPGTRLVMQVRVWDSTYGDFDQASMFNQAGLLPVFEWGAPPVGGPSADHRMFNFVGGIPMPVPEPTLVWLLVSVVPMAFLLLRRGPRAQAWRR